MGKPTTRRKELRAPRAAPRVAQRVAIVGSRAYPAPERVEAYVRRLPAGTVVVSGGAPGVDRTAEAAARARGLEVRVHLPDWKRLGKAAGYARNQTIVDDANRVVAFWDGVSRGTMHTIGLARRAGKKVVVFGERGQRVSSRMVNRHRPEAMSDPAAKVVGA